MPRAVPDITPPLRLTRLRAVLALQHVDVETKLRTAEGLGFVVTGTWRQHEHKDPETSSITHWSEYVVGLEFDGQEYGMAQASQGGMVADVKATHEALVKLRLLNALVKESLPR